MRPTLPRVLTGIVIALFLLGLAGWLVQGAGSDDPVPTVPLTTPPPPTEPAARVPTVSVVPGGGSETGPTAPSDPTP